jgi:thioredoxin reductase (NADPH)
MENFKERPVSEIVSKPPPRNRVLVYGRPDSPEAYAIRDLLSRSGVVFDWIELAGDDDGRRALGLSTLDHVQLPIVHLLDGVQLFAPTVAASLSTYLLVRVTQTTNVEILYHAQVTELNG